MHFLMSLRMMQRHDVCFAVSIRIESLIRVCAISLFHLHIIFMHRKMPHIIHTASNTTQGLVTDGLLVCTYVLYSYVCTPKYRCNIFCFNCWLIHWAIENH